MALDALSVVAGLVLGLLILAAWVSTVALLRRKPTSSGVQPTMLPIAALLDSIDDLAWIKDRQSRFILVNRKFGAVFGVAPQDLVGKSDFDLSTPEMAARYVHDDMAVMRVLSR